MSSKKRGGATQTSLTSFFNKKSRIDKSVESFPSDVNNNNVGLQNEPSASVEHPINRESNVNTFQQRETQKDDVINFNKQSRKKVRKYVIKWYSMYGVYQLVSSEKYDEKLQCVVCKFKFQSIKGDVLKDHYYSQHRVNLEVNSSEKFLHTTRMTKILI